MAWDNRRTGVEYGLAPNSHHVVFEGALLRVRPKVMTVATIFAGLIPIMYGDGTGSEIMQRINRREE